MTLVSFLTLVCIKAEAASILLPQDHTVLWPLKFSPATDNLFRTTGDGFCNAPQMIKDKILAPSIAQNIFAAAFNAQGKTCATQQQFADLILERSAEQLVDPKIPLIMVFGVPPNVCDPDLWRVVGMRADPCQNIIDHNKNGTACRTQLRLVLQPFEKSMDNLNTVLDFTLHLIFEVPDPKALIADLNAVATISRKSEGATPWEAEFDGKSLLRPHHGLRNEMDQCGGPVSTAFKSLIKEYAVEDRLSSVATMGSSFGVKEWTFTAFKRQTGSKPPALPVTELHGSQFDNFSDTLFADGKYSLNSNLDQGAPIPTIRQEITLAAAHQKITPAAVQPHFAKLQSILNPLEVSQLGTSCAGCHLAPQTLRTLETLSGTSADKHPKTFDAQVWPGFDPAGRSFAHLRNLGYGPGFNLSINRRTINEAMAAQSWFKKNPLP